ncbi:MAG: FKBP-type peptidyl-prolyl cis-trans isomerase [Bacteroidia bacterium]|nr:FKBP-type peptidyl-prolyl cis-trans isomerase [Bacteroidia bacterium]
MDSMSYALGFDLGKNLGKLELDLNSDMVYKGMSDVLKGEETLLTDNDVRKWLATFQQKAQAAQQKAQAAQFEQVKAEGELFLEENKKKDGVVVTPSGLQYLVLKEGKGPKPASPSTTVKVHYEGKLLDDTIFDSSYQRGEPTSFALNRVISGWTEGLQLMNEGAKYRFFIPYNLAYGQRGAGQSIPPYATLIFEVELLEIVK